MVDASNSTGPVIEDTTVSGNDLNGTTLVDASDCTDPVVNGTVVKDNELINVTGVDVSGSNDPVVNGTVFENNRPVTGGTLVDASNSTGPVIEDTTVSGNDLNGTTLVDASDCTDPVVNNTLVKDNELINITGISVSDSDDPVVNNTRFINNRPVEDSTLVDASNSTGPVIEDTTVSGNNLTNSTGVDLSGSQDASVENTIIGGNDIGDTTLIDASDSTDAVINNIALSNNDLDDVVGIDVDDADNITISNLNENGNLYSVIFDVGADDINVGDDAVVNVTVVSSYVPISGGEGVPVNGNVTITVDGKEYTGTLVDGKASVHIPGLSAGDYILSATFDGSESAKPASGNGSFVVSKVDDYSMGIENTTVIPGSDLVVVLPDDATGNVTVTIGNETFTVPVRDGKAVIPMDNIAAGEYPVVIVYSGDDKYAPSNMTDVVDIIGGIIINAPDVVKYYLGPERFVVTITDYAGNPVDGKSVNITINGVTYYRITKNGTASLAIILNSGIYNTTVDIEGNGTRYATVTVLPTVNATDLVKVFRNGTQFWATFYDSEGNYLPEGTAVTFNIHGVTYTRYVSGDKGLAKLNINLEQGSYIITAINSVTGEKASNNVTVIPRLIENYDLTKYFRNASQYTVKAIGDDGSIGAGVVVTFNVHGVFYNRTTDANGIAKLNINLEPGDYVITAEYAGCRVSNNIHVLPVLTAKDLSMKYRDGSQFVATLVDGQGNPYAGQTVQFNIHGVFYNRVTDSNGQAKLNINLQAGKYIITAYYGQARVSNTITVSA